MRKTKEKIINYCVYSNKIIGKQEAVLKEYVKDYLEKEGYIVLEADGHNILIRPKEWFMKLKQIKKEDEI